MSDKRKNLKISLGIFTGYCLGILINVIFFEKDFITAFSDKKLIFLFAGIITTAIIIRRKSSSN